MTGATVTPPKSAWSAPAKGQRPSSNVNIMGVEAVTKRLDWLLRTGSNNNNPNEFVKLCILLSKGIDHAVEHNEISNEVSKRLPSLVKQVCQRRNGSNVDAAIMVLMISVKNACKIRWFSEKEAEELLDLFKELGNEFCGPGGNLESISVISTIMSRHCPQLKLGKILASLDVKPGFDAYVIDFFIPKILKISPGEKLHLLVTQTDKIDTSACMVNPQQVNFLLNGKGVERRTNISMDTGPQSPTDLTSMLKHGTNLLQAIGEFTGPCIIAVAFMSVTSLADDVTMQHNAQPDVTAPDPDSNKFEGQSRSSPTCPIRQQEFPPPFTCPPTQNWSRQNHAPRGSSGQLDPQSKKQPSIQPSSPLTQHVQAGVGNTADSWSRLDPQSRKQPSIQSSSPLQTQTQHAQAGVGNTADSRSQLDPFRKQPSMQSPSPLQTQTQHVQAGVGNTADSRSRFHSMSNAAARQEDKRAPDPRFVPVKLGTSGTGTPNPINGERGARAQVMEQGSQVGMTMQASPVGTVREKNWQPTARMRGSLSASAYKAYEDKIIKPTQAAQATGPPPGFTQQPQSTDSRNGHIPETSVPTTGASNQGGGGNDVERMNQTVWRWL